MAERLAPPRAVLFDFDGTLADTAADLGGALNRLRSEHGLPGMTTAEVRSYASSGARGLLRVGFGMLPGDPRYETMRDGFLARYDERICVDTRLFPGFDELLPELARRGIPWGIVTNKSSRFTPRLVEALGIAEQTACVVCGDTTPHLKPHPAPLLHAAQALKLDPAECWYVGDDLRDIHAARAAGMGAIAVEYGYHGVDNGHPSGWNADAVLSRPQDLIGLL